MSSKPIFKSPEGKAVILKMYDSILKDWPVEHETFTIPTRHGETFVIASGKKTSPPIILIHGSSSNAAMWLGDIPKYSEEYRVYAVDIPGEPGKSEVVRSDLRSSAYVEWMDDILTFLNITKTTLLGMSLGGWMALKFAISRSEKVNQLILLCPSGVATQKISFTLRVIFYFLFGKWGLKRLTKIFYGKQSVPEEAVQYSTLISQNFNPRMEIIPLFSDEELARLRMPTLLIVGALDPLLPSKKTAERLKRLLPNITVNLLPDVGHVILNVTDQIISFLNKH